MGTAHGYVYAIGIEGTDLVKIGWARNARSRLRTLQRETEARLSLSHAIRVEDPRRVESALHRHLATYRVQGEWFEVPRAVVDAAMVQLTHPVGHLKRLTLDIPADLHKAFKRLALEEGTTMVDLTETLIENYLREKTRRPVGTDLCPTCVPNDAEPSQ